MHNKATLAALALCYGAVASAQTAVTTDQSVAKTMDENAFTFTEAQLGEDDNMSQNVTILNSNSNVYASEVGYLFSPVRFRYRALNQKYNDVYINGAPMNDMESGQFRFSQVGGLNRFTRNVDFALPFEGNNFSVPGMAGSNNYDLRAGSMGAGHYASMGVANRNYTLRGMYTYASGFNSRGWAVAAGLTYRWANRGYVEGTFYNALSYYLGVQKKWGNTHSLSFATWGNPTERSTQGASTDEAYWLANDRYYNPYWGYQNGHKRNSRVVNDYSPSALFTWDWNINDNTRLTTTLFGKYGMYKSTKLNYSNAENPQPDYWKNMPSSFADVWGTGSVSADALSQFNTAYNYWTASKANRQIDWDRLYEANHANALVGGNALYYIQAKHNDNLNVTLSSTITSQLSKNQRFNGGVMLAQNIGRHYQTMEDMLGAMSFRNVNTYAMGDYAIDNPYIQYDLNNPNGFVTEGDKFGYDYELRVRRALGWAAYSETFGRLHYTVAGRMGYDGMDRKGYMRNGMFADNSYGRSRTANFLSGGAKLMANFDAGRGHVFNFGLGYEHRAPQASTAFVSPEMNNDFVLDLRNERVFTTELGYQYQNAWLHTNLSAYYSRMTHVTEWQNYFSDYDNSFTYVSMTGINKHYYGIEAGFDVKLTSFLNFKALGTISEAENTNNSRVTYMNSTSAAIRQDVVWNKGMRENGTPLTAASLGLSFHQSGWYIDLNANYYDNIYLSYAPVYRYQSVMDAMGLTTNEGEYAVPEQQKGHGGWMMDGSIGKSVRLKHGQLNFNLMVTNILNNQTLVSGGYEQSRLDASFTDAGERNKDRTYKFSRNPKKYYIFGTNGMFQVSYRF